MHYINHKIIASEFMITKKMPYELSSAQKKGKIQTNKKLADKLHFFQMFLLKNIWSIAFCEQRDHCGAGGE